MKETLIKIKFCILTILALAVGSAQAGCGGYLQGSTMCLMAADCRQAGGAPCGPVAEGDQQTILQTHNKYRETVAQGLEKRGNPGPQPAGTNIHELVWNDELARLAQRWAEQLVDGHDCSGNCKDSYYCRQSCRDTKQGKGSGQNIAATGSSLQYTAATDWASQIKGWYDEVKDANAHDRVVSFSNCGAIGHYTQVIWHSTKAIGCGVYGNNKLCTALNWPDYYCLNYICNYYPRGNMISEEPYSTTEKCTTYSKNYPSLCAAN